MRAMGGEATGVGGSVGLLCRGRSAFSWIVLLLSGCRSGVGATAAGCPVRRSESLLRPNDVCSCGSRGVCRYIFRVVLCCIRDLL